MPRWLEQWMYPIDKTDLDVLRFAHFLALAAVTVRFLPKDWAGLKSPWLRPLILCGQHSLEIFCLGVFLAFAGHFVLAEVSGGAVLHVARQRLPESSSCPARRGCFHGTSIPPTRVRRDKKHHRQRRSGGGKLMRSSSGAILGLIAAGRLCCAAPARADDAAERAPKMQRRNRQSCEVPAYLLTTDSPLPKVAEAVKSGQPLNILVVGSRSSTIPSSEASAYPARLQAI